MTGRFSHPRSTRRFATSALAIVAAQKYAETHSDGDLSLGIYEHDETEGRRQLARVERLGEAVLTTKIAEAIREEPEMATKTTRTRKGGTEVETVEEAVDHTDPNTVVEEIDAETVAAVDEVVAEALAPENGRAEVDREKVTKAVKAKMTRADAPSRIGSDRYEAAVKYAVRMQLHKDGVRTKPTDFARHGLTKDDVVVLAEALGI